MNVKMLLVEPLINYVVYVHCFSITIILYVAHVIFLLVVYTE
jgi:hypothetical protein